MENIGKEIETETTSTVQIQWILTVMDTTWTSTKYVNDASVLKTFIWKKVI